MVLIYNSTKDEKQQRAVEPFSHKASAPPAEREASGCPLEGGGSKRSLFKFVIRSTKYEIHPPQAGKNSNDKNPNDKSPIRKVIKIYGTQIFTDKLFSVRLAAQDAVQHRLSEEISLFFSRRRRWRLLVFESVCIRENLCPRFRISNF